MDITITSPTVETHEGQTALVKGAGGGAYIALALSKDEAASVGVQLVDVKDAEGAVTGQAFQGSPTITVTVK